MTARRLSLALAAGLALALPTAVPAQNNRPVAQAQPDPALLAAVSGGHRPAAEKARDAHRRPAETLAFWGLKPGVTVVEINPGGGYWSRILAPYAKATRGKYVATVGMSEQSRNAFAANFADEAVWGKPEYAPYGPNSAQLVAPGTADIVITARNIHNWMWVPGQLDKYLKDFHAALKPGGILAVEEHRSDPRPMVPEARDGYVSTASVIAAAEKAGFRLEAQSELNANPKDKKDHPFGVWTLPPTRRDSQTGTPTPANFNRATFDAVGESDRMTLRFRKPG